MGGTHKRDMRAEKAKVKLKGAKLPKGLNVTKTDFKVRKIMIRDQLKESQYVEGQRHFNIKETLSRLKHHSSNFRLEALRNLRESLSAGKANHLLGHLNELTQGIAAASLDLERNVRRESFQTLGSLLAALEPEAISPFFHVISSYLRCAMTHIQAAIQEDALLMLDVLLKYVPKLLADHSEKIFQNFLEMISRVRADGSDRVNRTLTVNMGQQQTTIKWRSKVLLRLQQMFATLVNEQRNVIDNKTIKCTVAKFNSKSPQHFALKRSYVVPDNNELSSLLGRKKILGPNETTISASNEMQVLSNYVEHLMPLLLETWAEVRPQAGANTDKSDQVLLSHDAATTLNIVLEIIEHLWILISRQEASLNNNNELSSWLRQHYADAFSMNFLGNSSFPFQQQQSMVDNKKSKKRSSGSASNKLLPDTAEQFCLQQNLSIAHLFCRFHPQPNPSQSSNFSSLLHYLNTIVSQLKEPNSAVSVECQAHLAITLRAFLLDNAGVLLAMFSTDMQNLLYSTIDAFLSNHFTTREGVAAKILVLLCDIVKNPVLYEAYGGPDNKFTNFLTFLPQLLLKSAVSTTALVAMSHLGRQQNQVFLNALVLEAEGILKNLQQIQIIGAINAFEGEKQILNLFYWACRPSFTHVINQLEEYITNKKRAKYFRFILSQ